MVKKLASPNCKCGQIRIKNQRYCRQCKNNYMKNWRKSHPLTAIQKFKDSVRSKTEMRIKRGLLVKYPCEICGEKVVHAHHEDYNKPYDIRWLCKSHHYQHHRENKK